MVNTLIRTSRLFIFLTVIISLFILPGCSNQDSSNKKFRIVVRLKKSDTSQKVFITGNNNTLGNWNPSKIILDKESDSIWSKTFIYPKGEKIEFKITGGSWIQEALNSKFVIYDNIKIRIEKDTTYYVDVYDWLNKFNNGSLVLNATHFQEREPIISIEDNWLFHPGDNIEWNKENFDDTRWIKINSYLIWDNINYSKWNNIGWFRFHLIADSSLWNKTIAISINQLGASQIYYNGKFLYSFGEVGNSSETFKPLQNWNWKAIKIEPKTNQLIAVRYANYNWKKQKNIWLAPGFGVYLQNMNTALADIKERTRSTTAQQMIFSSILLILALLHLFIFGFYRKQKQNLFHAICLLGASGLAYFNYQRIIETNPNVIVFYYQLFTVVSHIVVFFALLTAYSITYIKIPKRWRIYLFLSVIIFIIRIVNPIPYIMGYISYGYIITTMVDIGYSFFRSKKNEQKAMWIIAVGFSLLGLFIIWQLLVDYTIVNAFYGIEQVWIFGMISFAVSMSVFLSYNFASANKNLEIQLNKVKELSEKAIEQERITNKLEFERRIIEIENVEKTKELESARELQLSLLPKKLPELDNLDISCYMITATEVGGDYYDFFVSDDKTLTAVIGDATGHGLKAGNMVIVTKGLLNVLSFKTDIVGALGAANNAIKKMNLNILTMSLAVLKINIKKIEYSSAGMPPLLIYRKATNEVEQFVLKAMPLGAFSNFPYSKVECEIFEGDVILMYSDGLIELFNSKKEEFGIERVIEVLKESSGKSAEGIKNDFVERSQEWLQGYSLKDDLTFVVIKSIR